MYKRLLVKILSIVLVCIGILFIVYKINSMNQTKENFVKIAKYLMDSISNEDYEKIGRYVKNLDGTELNEQQISNFLLNTELYRATLIKEKDPIFTYSTNMNLFNTKEGSIVFSFKALNGELITNEIKYVNTGTNEYFITDKIQECNKEKQKYPVRLDLANGRNIGYDNSSREDINTAKIKIYSFIQDENGKVFVEVIEEAKQDVKVAMINMIYEELDSLKNINEKYNIEWDNECKEFSIYYESDVDKKIIATKMKLQMQLCAVVVQSLNGNSDWHLKINYYHYNTNELLKTETIR